MRRLLLRFAIAVVVAGALPHAGPVAEAQAASCSTRYVIVFYSNSSGSSATLLEFKLTACWDFAAGVSYANYYKLVDYTDHGYPVRVVSSSAPRRDMGWNPNVQWVGFDFRVALEEYYGSQLHPRIYFHAGSWVGCNEGGGSFLYLRLPCEFRTSYLNI